MISSWLSCLVLVAVPSVSGHWVHHTVSGHTEHPSVLTPRDNDHRQQQTLVLRPAHIKCVICVCVCVCVCVLVYYAGQNNGHGGAQCAHPTLPSSVAGSWIRFREKVVSLKNTFKLTSLQLIVSTQHTKHARICTHTHTHTQVHTHTHTHTPISLLTFHSNKHASVKVHLHAGTHKTNTGILVVC